MAQYSRIEVATVMAKTGLVPLFYHDDVEVSKKVLKACYDGGARLLEFTSRGDFAYEIFAELNKYAIAELPGMVLGIGSVTDAAAASLYMQLGANFIVTPVLREDIALVCNRRKVLWSPGCATLTEIAKAEELGCEIVKLFPGDAYSPGYVKAMKGPCPWTSIMPTGGVAPTKESLTSWFDAGVTCVGIGSKLIVKHSSGNFDYAEIERLTAFSIKCIKQIKS
ncbi:bifunctional 4-hydroxy-2-oxoglutarate aldolase/2-dehydro-3-deoxy-phosphogluconate aldolase [Gelidibacter salicanalis]|uniref:Bifunctional 4-hydroxy-2-oxoglutarate aldolase/2-dehydro-3-deoxy-phosphogluconate aldolase n=1 Tax=Gelidibacter salicanalis TaxID=291193 RepID=A0A934NIX6_9FLAO|nr:bifunctional 4-hydroxy-2-oxoglutarate aldolase/2-dehydro-3-deoxy-phosphogluconate aldolase [Gelidibacter salicanalis]MBJ7880619.1 bifunctional 4-hydroxy-2-oxoglutarate aldolase/2-dehydro-3-deoxy-phosphogluconate aldolase [Gelidibacter salicanalis]